MKTKKHKKQSNVERFYLWLQACGNVYLNDNDEMIRAFNKIPEYENNL